MPSVWGDENNPVDPELAAQVVRQYVLPMFEGQRKELDTPSTTDGALDEVVAAEAPPQEGVLGELLLSERLLEQMRISKMEQEELQRALRSSEAERERLLRKLSSSSREEERLRREADEVREEQKDVRRKSQYLDSECTILRTQISSLRHELRRQQQENERLTAQVQDREGKVEVLATTVAQNRNTSSLSKLENEVMLDQIRQLHSASQQLAGVKHLRDSAAFTRDFGELKIAQTFLYKNRLYEELNRISSWRDELIDITQELALYKEALNQENNILTKELEEARQTSKESFNRIFDEKESDKKNRDRMDKKYREVLEDRDRIRAKLKKYRVRRKIFATELKTCRHCLMEFMERENFNWSCRTHTSDFSGEMWWCCGSLGRDAPGCRFTKHIPKDDDEDIEDQDKKDPAEQERLAKKNIRCWSCREVGHKAKDCGLDPNPRTTYEPSKELQRLEHLTKANTQKMRIARGRALVNLINESSVRVAGPAADEAVMADDIDPKQSGPFRDILDEAVRADVHRGAGRGGRLTLRKGNVLMTGAEEEESEESDFDSAYDYFEEIDLPQGLALGSSSSSASSADDEDLADAPLRVLGSLAGNVEHDASLSPDKHASQRSSLTGRSLGISAAITDIEPADLIDELEPWVEGREVDLPSGWSEVLLALAIVLGEDDAEKLARHMVEAPDIFLNRILDLRVTDATPQALAAFRSQALPLLRKCQPATHACECLQKWLLATGAQQAKRAAREQARARKKREGAGSQQD